MLRPEIMNRIRQTNNAGLERWLKANMIEAANKWYEEHPELKASIIEESDFIISILKVRTKSPA